jgi:hypothetical protein
VRQPHDLHDSSKTSAAEVPQDSKEGLAALLPTSDKAKEQYLEMGEPLRKVEEAARELRAALKQLSTTASGEISVVEQPATQDAAVTQQQQEDTKALGNSVKGEHKAASSKALQEEEATGGKMPDRLSQEYKMEQQLLLQVVFLLLQLLLHGLINICYGFINIIAYIYSKGINMQQVTPTPNGAEHGEPLQDGQEGHAQQHRPHEHRAALRERQGGSQQRKRREPAWQGAHLFAFQASQYGGAESGEAATG